MLNRNLNANSILVGRNLGAHPMFAASAYQPSPSPFGPAPGGDFFWSDAMGTDTCDLVVVNLSAYYDGELDEDTQQLIQDHLSKCADCSTVLHEIAETDGLIQREWRDRAPLPSPLAIDAIMNALPAQPERPIVFEPRRVHARTRWMRLTTNICCAFLLFGMLLTSYALGFASGRDSLPQPRPIPRLPIATPLHPLTHHSLEGIIAQFTTG